MPGDLRQHWYLRYQPLSHLEIDPALGRVLRSNSRLLQSRREESKDSWRHCVFLVARGGYEGLQRLCEDAANLRVMVPLGDPTERNHEACRSKTDS